MKITICLICALFLFACSSEKNTKTIQFKSEDGLSITADHYPKTGADTYIILFHQAEWSRGEYREIAPKLNKRGYACLAVDQRSGGEINDVVNETHKNAIATDKPTEYIDAFQDIKASVTYARDELKAKKILIWGSSYSSSLVLKYGSDHPDLIDGIVSFSPGEYFDDKQFITNCASKITAPVFITSAKNEQKVWQAIYDNIPTSSKAHFIPETEGNHGSRSLWEQFEDHKAYWVALDHFLTEL